MSTPDESLWVVVAVVVGVVVVGVGLGVGSATSSACPGTSSVATIFAAMTSVIEREQELLKLAETRGARRAGIIRKAATRDLKRLRRQTKGAADAAADSTAEALGSDAEDGCAILREVVVTADPALFVESKHSHAWSRCEVQAFAEWSVQPTGVDCLPFLESGCPSQLEPPPPLP